jgi:Trk-type K+ transport system membrane component
VRITRLVFTGMRALFRLRGSRARSFEARDRDLALYGPISLTVAWLVLIGTGYMLMFWSLGERPLRQALVLSGSWIYTLGFEVPANLPTTVLALSEAGFGLVLLAMLIGYLPRSTCGPTPHRPRPPWCSSARRTGSTRG